MEAVFPTWPEWETESIIGRGGFGAVYKIKRDVLGTVEYAALKVIRIPRDPNEIEEMFNEGYDQQSITDTFKDNLKGIVEEYKLMRKLVGCANIIHCDDVRYVQHDDGIGWDIYIKMELLTPLMKSLPPVPAPIPVDTVVRVGIDICRALELCQTHDIVHRDIKPQNIFLSPNGDYKLGDFGVAKTMERTMRATVAGTLKYMAPEISFNRPYCANADLYSLGLVLYWMLNQRRHPFMPLPPAGVTSDMEEQSHMRRIGGEPLPPPAMGTPALKSVILKACAYQPSQRYTSAAAMRRDLEAVLAGKGQGGGGTPKPSKVLCPRCGARHPLGSTVCKYCKTPIPQ